MTDKPRPNPATSKVADSVFAKLASFDADPDNYEGTAAVVEPATTKETHDDDED